MTDNSLAVIRDYARSDIIKSRFTEIIGSSRSASAYISSVLIAVGNSDKLQECTPQSIIISAMRAATLRLSCDPSTGQAWLLPFRGKATLVVGYKGLHAMAIRTGKYRYLNVAKIREGQTVEEDQLKGIHTIVGYKKNDNPIGYLLYFELYEGYSKTFYMTVDEILQHAEKTSKSFNYSDSPWKTNTETMMMKTVLRLGLTRWGYFDPIDAMALGIDETEGGEEQLPEPSEVITGELIDYGGEGQIMNDLGFEKEPEPQKKKYTWDNQNHVDLLVKEQLAENEYSAKGMLNLSEVLKPDHGDAVIRAWAKEYRKARDPESGNMTARASAGVADEMLREANLI